MTHGNCSPELIETYSAKHEYTASDSSFTKYDFPFVIRTFAIRASFVICASDLLAPSPRPHSPRGEGRRIGGPRKLGPRLHRLCDQPGKILEGFERTESN